MCNNIHKPGVPILLFLQMDPPTLYVKPLRAAFRRRNEYFTQITTPTVFSKVVIINACLSFFEDTVLGI